MMGVLFLDIDGVVLNGKALWNTANNRYLPPEKISLVREVCDRTGVAIVVSSTWRRSDETRDMLRFAGLTNIHTDWRTDHKGSLRGEQIKRWVDAHPEVGTYAILDDDSDMLPEQMTRFVKTNHADGIEREHVERLVEILSSPQVIP